MKPNQRTQRRHSAPKDKFFFYNNNNIQLSLCNTRLSLSNANSQISVFKPKVDEILLLTVNSSRSSWFVLCCSVSVLDFDFWRTNRLRSTLSLVEKPSKLCVSEWLRVSDSPELRCHNWGLRKIGIGRTTRTSWGGWVLEEPRSSPLTSWGHGFDLYKVMV